VLNYHPNDNDGSPAGANRHWRVVDAVKIHVCKVFYQSDTTFGLKINLKLLLDIWSLQEAKLTFDIWSLQEAINRGGSKGGARAAHAPPFGKTFSGIAISSQYHLSP
jgi:hypothetical protein